MRNSMKKITHQAFWLLKEIFAISFYVFVILFILLSAGAFYLYYHTPSAAELYKRKIPETTMIFDRTGEHLLYEIHGEEDRKIISHAEIPDTIRLTTIAAEDDNFYHHYGIDPFSIARAFFMNIKNNSITQGGSTITQQLARNAFLSREKTLRRKILETIMAFKIEKKFNKAAILDMYLNEVPYGANAYGVEAAAQTYFGKKASELTLDEAALLAAIPKATTYYSPYGQHRQQLVVRQKEILRRLQKLKLADSQTIATALGNNTLTKILPFSEPIQAPHFVFYVRAELEKKYGQKATEENGLRIVTTLDYALQKSAEKIIRESAEINLKKYGAANAALVALDPKNGQILAMVGSNDYFDQGIDGAVNVTTRPRQPGSSFKPFAYAAAFEKGYQPETLIIDAPTDFGPDGSGQDYIPRNYDGKSHGVVSMRQALAMSLNVPAVKTLRLVGVDETIAMAHRLGITTLNERNRYGLSLVIGGGEVTLLDETAGYSVFANDGQRNPLDPFLKITDSQEKILYQNMAQNLPVLDPQVARKINSILSDNAARISIFGPNNLLHIDGVEVAAKTGTTQEWRDGWTVGYTPALAVGVWVGNNNNRPMRAGADGSYVAAPIWNKVMVQALQNRPPENFLAYEKNDQGIKLADNMQFAVTYFNKKTGKKISASKKDKMKPEKVETRLEIIATTQENIATAVDYSLIDKSLLEKINLTP